MNKECEGGSPLVSAIEAEIDRIARRNLYTSPVSTREDSWNLAIKTMQTELTDGLRTMLTESAN